MNEDDTANWKAGCMQILFWCLRAETLGAHSSAQIDNMSLGLSVTDRQSVLLGLLNLLFFLHFFFYFFVLKGTPKHPESIWGLVVFL